MTKEEAQEVWAAASSYRWRGFDVWWEETNNESESKKAQEKLDEIKAYCERIMDKNKEKLGGFHSNSPFLFCQLETLDMLHARFFSKEEK